MRHRLAAQRLAERLHRRPDVIFIKWGNDGAVMCYTFAYVNAGIARRRWGRFRHVEIEEARPPLAGKLEHVAESGRCQHCQSSTHLRSKTALVASVVP